MKQIKCDTDADNILPEQLLRSANQVPNSHPESTIGRWDPTAHNKRRKERKWDASQDP